MQHIPQHPHVHHIFLTFIILLISSWEGGDLSDDQRALINIEKNIANIERSMSASQIKKDGDLKLKVYSVKIRFFSNTSYIILG